MAAAPDFHTLLAFEDQIEPAVLMLLANNSAPACRERDPGTLATPRVEVRLQMGPATGRRFALPGAIRSPSQTLPDAWNGQLVLTTITNRLSTNPPNAQRHGELVGKSRFVMLQAIGGLNAQLEWLTIQRIDDAGVIPTVNANSDLDMSPAVFPIQFAIRPEAWPALPTVS